jgi:hypothetical protein
MAKHERATVLRQTYIAYFVSLSLLKSCANINKKHWPLTLLFPNLS